MLTFETIVKKQEEIENLKSLLIKTNKVLIAIKQTDPKMFDGKLIQEIEKATGKII